MRKIKKFFAVLTAGVIAMTLMMPATMPAGVTGAVAVRAAETTEVQGKCGDKAIYKYDAKEKTLTVSGTGELWNDAGFAKGLDWIENIKIEEGITVIGEYSFEGLWNITSVELPSTLTTIKKGAFEYIRNTVVIPKSVKKIEKNAFKGAKKFVLKGDAIGLEPAAFGSSIEEVEICGNGAELGKALAANGRTNVKIANSNEQCKIANGCIVSMDGKTLYYCVTCRDEIVIIDTVETIAPAALYTITCDKITLGKNVKTIGAHAFEGSYIKTLVVNNNLKNIEMHAFADCLLKEVKLNGKVSIGVGAFDSSVKISNRKKFKNNIVSIESAKLKNKKMTLKFTKIHGAKGYQIRVKKGKKTYNYTTTKTKYTKTLPKNVYDNYTVKKSYEISEYNTEAISGAAYVTVRPYKNVKKKKSYGTWSAKIVLSK